MNQSPPIISGGGVTLSAHIRPYEGTSLPDPQDPEWQGTCYMRYIPNGKVSAVPMWRGQEYISDPYKRWEQVTKEEYDAWEGYYLGEESLSLESGRPIKFDPKTIGDVHPVEKESTVPEPDKVLDAVTLLNDKFDKLTDAIILLASQNKPNDKE